MSRRSRLSKLERDEVPTTPCPLCKVGRDAAGNQFANEQARAWSVVFMWTRDPCIRDPDAEEDPSWEPSEEDREHVRQMLRQWRCPKCNRVTEKFDWAKLVKGEFASASPQEPQQEIPWYLQD